MASRSVERLLNVIMTLGSRSRMDRARLFAVIPDYAQAPSLDAAQKMFERDKAAIRELGLPLLSERDPWDESVVHYRIDADDTGEALDLSTAEYTVLLAASRAWDEAQAGGPARRVRAKLLSQGLDADTDLLRRTPRGSVESLPVLTPLLEAVTAGRRVSFDYRTAAGDLARRHVEPWVVGVHDGRWYVLGHDTDREAARVFRASRIESFPAVGAAARTERPADVSLETALADVGGDGDTGCAVLDVEPYKALTLRDVAGADLAAREVHLPRTTRTAALRRVRAHARWITLAEPGPWRTELARTYQAIAGAHSGAADPDTIEQAPVRPSTAIRRSASGTDDLTRLIGLASYVLNRGEVELGELSAEFGTSENQLVMDLQVLFLCGDLGTGWEDLIEAEWEGGVVRVRNADALRRPLRLTAAEATALLAGLAAVEPVAAAEAAVVAGARAKLKGLVGAAAPTGPSGPSGDSPAAQPPRRERVLAALQRAISEGERVWMRYSPPDRPGTTVRDVLPLHIESGTGRAYLRADCASAGGVRQFRLDRIVELLPDDAGRTAAHEEPGATSSAGDGLRGREDIEDVWIRLQPPAVWIAEAFEASELRDHPDGGTLALLPSPVRSALLDAVFEAAGAAELLTPGPLRDLIVTSAADAAARHRARTR